LARTYDIPSGLRTCSWVQGTALALARSACRATPRRRCSAAICPIPPIVGCLPRPCNFCRRDAFANAPSAFPIRKSFNAPRRRKRTNRQRTVEVSL